MANDTPMVGGTYPVPKVRAPGSPYARKYGATDNDGKPIKASLTPVNKGQAWVPKDTSRRDAAALSPLERARGRQPDVTGQRQTYAALRRLNGAPVQTRPRRVRKSADDPQVAVYDANGNLLGIVDPDKVVELSTGTPPQPGSAQDPTDMDAAAARSVQSQQQAVAKSKSGKVLTLRDKWKADALAKQARVKKAQTKSVVGLEWTDTMGKKHGTTGVRNLSVRFADGTRGTVRV